ncbi:DASH complex subunit Ask1-domain-containing protein [Yarrowia lipolytica]|nr:hypothetical protein YALI1_B13915g [Yarrowia lipolytica]KAB8281073.1 DASH complex subunit Ask1-domain-containing protein [Yarrowia lipolytica]KAE8170303.1 DASH complex subunit Ask1-domain-containing protein [Yarrowia lipolytica]RMJ01057.1 DASH complex subunit Ask1-domain-containing protein [Yarrowia lipolytica]
MSTVQFKVAVQYASRSQHKLFGNHNLFSYPSTMATELEQLEQAITRALQDIDRNITRCNRAVEHGILPALEQYNRGSGKVWDKGGHFWMDFLEKAACVKFTTHDEDVGDEAHTVEDPSMTEKVPLKQDSYETEASMLQSITNNMDSVVELGEREIIKDNDNNNNNQMNYSNLLSELDDESMDVSMDRNTPDANNKDKITPRRRSVTSTPRKDRHASSGKRSKIPQPDYSLEKTPERATDQPAYLKHALESASKKYDHELARAAKRGNFQQSDNEEAGPSSSSKTGFNFKPSFITKSAYASTEAGGGSKSASKATPSSSQPWYMNVDLDDSFDLPSPPKLSSMNWKPGGPSSSARHHTRSKSDTPPTETQSVMRQRINDKEYHIEMSPAKGKQPLSAVTKSSGSYSPFHPKKMDAASTPARTKLFTPKKPSAASRYKLDQFSDDDSDMLSPPQLTTHMIQWDNQQHNTNKPTEAGQNPPSATRERSPERAARKDKERADSPAPADFDYKSGHTPFAKTPLALRMDRERLQQRTENLVGFGSPNKDIFGAAAKSTTAPPSAKYDMLSFNDSGESFQPPDLSPPVTIKFDTSRLQFTPAKDSARRVVQGALREAGGELDSDDSMGSF